MGLITKISPFSVFVNPSSTMKIFSPIAYWYLSILNGPDAAVGVSGQVFTILPKESACYFCMFPDLDEDYAYL